MTAAPWVEPALLFVRGGARVRGTIAVGAPSVVDEAEARCTVEIRAPGVLEARAAIGGADPLQALLLALPYLSIRLRHFTERGRVLMECDGGAFPLDAYFGEVASPAPTVATIRIRARRRRFARSSRPPGTLSP